MILFGPTYKYENKLYKQGYQNIAGLDEAGRGAWAGPVVAAAVILPARMKIAGIRDSKLLSPQQREKLAVYINKQALAIGLGIISEKVIDQQGIIPATRKAFLAAVERLREKVDYLLIDGIRIFDHRLPNEFLVRGDRLVVSIAAASIVAKVVRDNILRDYHQHYPQYGFDLHKGYGTRLHKERLDEYGVCEIHRRSFRPMIENFEVLSWDD